MDETKFTLSLQVAGDFGVSTESLQLHMEVFGAAAWGSQHRNRGMNVGAAGLSFAHYPAAAFNRLMNQVRARETQCNIEQR